MRLYEIVTTVDAHLIDKMKRVMLEHTVHHIAELRTIKTAATQLERALITQGSKPMTYESYLLLLLYAASTYDKQFNNQGQKSTRAVYSHSFIDHPSQDIDINHHEDLVDCGPHDIDTSLDTIHAFAAQFDRQACMSSSQ